VYVFELLFSSSHPIRIIFSSLRRVSVLYIHSLTIKWALKSVTDRVIPTFARGPFWYWNTFRNGQLLLRSALLSPPNDANTVDLDKNVFFSFHLSHSYFWLHKTHFLAHVALNTWTDFSSSSFWWNWAEMTVWTWSRSGLCWLSLHSGTVQGFLLMLCVLGHIHLSLSLLKDNHTMMLPPPCLTASWV